jgi:hypothetical protein
MLKVLVLVGAFLFFRAVLPRNSRSSPSAISPYVNGLDGAMSAREASSVLDEFMPYESWVAGRRAAAQKAGQADQPAAMADRDLAIPAGNRVHGERLHP